MFQTCARVCMPARSAYARRFSTSAARCYQPLPPILNALWTSTSLYMPVSADPYTQTVLAEPGNGNTPSDDKPDDGAKWSSVELSERLLSLTRRGHSPHDLEFSKTFFGHSHPLTGKNDAPGAVSKAGRPRMIYTADTFYDHPPNEIVPEILVLGCSNAGKSTLINAVLDCKLARASSTPGYTKFVNGYGCGRPTLLTPGQREHVVKMPPPARTKQYDALKHSLVLLDTPGYGHKSIQGWGKHIEKLIFKRRQLRGVVLLLRGDLPDQVPTAGDKQILHILASANLPINIVLTRADREGDMWPLAAWTIARKVQSILGDRGDWGTDSRGRGLWDGGVWITAAGIDRTKIQPSRDKDNVGIRGLRAALLNMAGLSKGRQQQVEEPEVVTRPRRDERAEDSDEEFEELDETGEGGGTADQEEIVPFDQIPVKTRAPRPQGRDHRRRRW